MKSNEHERLKQLELRQERRNQINKIALALLQQCKSENLTMEELDSVLSIVKQRVAETTLRDGLVL